MLNSLLNKELCAYDLKTMSYPIRIKIIKNNTIQFTENQWASKGRIYHTHEFECVETDSTICLYNSQTKYTITKNDEGMVFNKNEKEYTLIEDFEIGLVV